MDIGQQKIEENKKYDESKELEWKENVVEFVTFVFLAVVFGIVRISRGDIIYDLCAIFGLILAIVYSIQFAKTKNKVYLVIIIPTVIFAVVMTILFFKYYGIM